LSIHADANPVASVRGASVYTLSEARSDKMLAEVADEGDFRIFNREFSAEDREVSSILFDLAKTDTKNQSERLAAALIRNMQGRIKMVNNTHRHAALVVLLSPDVPAVLVELAFMSNELDEANLGSRTWRNNATMAIADGIDAYFATGRRAGAASGSARGN
ncbi:MAG: N-acetylmuramoyl-L-alanine amidase, partial [Pseudomonadota bacterium]